MSVVRAREEHGDALLRLTLEDPVLNAFIIYDWRRLRGTGLCDFYVAVGEPSGVVGGAWLITKTTDMFSPVLRS